ncbi:hypothetical protein ACKGJO_05475 [Gracilimonas sp. Q87]|uniref:hypothetical protein n=1 Tax=Gracilimonas sp. Q87 TaxID=3384766 RepID=UPI003984292F
MKIKNYTSQIIAMLTLVFLVSGFQLKSTDSETRSLENIVGIEEAYAGPCGDAGCDGSPGYCGTTTVVKVLGWRITKDCVGSEEGDFPSLSK